MRAGIWLTPADGRAALQADDTTRYSWPVELPEGWVETTATIGLDSHAGLPALVDLKVGLSDRTSGPLGWLAPVGGGSAPAAWTTWGAVQPGAYTLQVSLPSGLGLRGLWLTNGPLPHGWPGEPPAVAVDSFLLPGQVRTVPSLPPSDLPLEYARQGLASHLNQQGAMGVADGKVTAVPRALRLRYVDAEVHVMLRTDDGLRRAKEICPDFELGLLDGHLLAPVARFNYDNVEYSVTFAAVPNGDEASDSVLVEARNICAEPRPNRLVVVLDAGADVAVTGAQIEAGGQTLAYFSPNARAHIVRRAIGCADLTATTVGDMYSTPFLPSWGQGRNPKYDLAFYAGRIGWDGRPVRYAFACPPGTAYTVYLGVFDTQWGGPGQKPIYAGEKVVRLGVDGAAELPVDIRGVTEPVLARFEAVDHDGDGIIKVFSRPDPAMPNSIGFLNAIWVFPPGTTVEPEALRQGSLNSAALHFVNVGGSLPGGVVDLIITEDWSFACAEISAADVIAPGGADQFQIGLPVNHRAEAVPYSQARYWREAGEDTPAYSARLSQRHAAAQQAVSDPAGALETVRAFWAARIASPVQYQVPDPAVQSIVKSTVAYFHAHRLKLGAGQYLPIGGGPMYYFDFSERDCGYEIVSTDVLGRHAESELLLNPYLTAMDSLNSPRWALGQDDQGMWMTRAREEDTQGQVLWALGEHFMLTRDLAWLGRAWPRIKAGLEYICRKRVEQKAAFPDPEDPRHGLWISGTDESKAWGTFTHSYYFNYWIECGLRMGVLEAEAIGDSAYAQVVRAEHADFLACLHKSLAKTYWRIDYRRGALPNAAEAHDSTNPWGVQEALWPSQSVPIWDPMVGQTLEYVDALAYPRVGGLTLGPRMLWPSAACDYAMMHLRRGEGDRAAGIFHSMVASCGLVNTWGETIFFSNGLTTGEQPYMWANACFVILMRQLLLHEAGDWLAGGASGPRELWICSGMPRQWLAEPDGVGVMDAPTYFGPVTFTNRFDPASRQCRAAITLTDERLPERLVVYFRTPLGQNLRRVQVNGVDHPYFTGEQVLVADPAAQLEIKAWL